MRMAFPEFAARVISSVDREDRVTGVRQGGVGRAFDLDRVVAARLQGQGDLPFVGAGVRGGGDCLEEDAGLIEVKHDGLGGVALPLDEILQAALPGLAACAGAGSRLRGFVAYPAASQAMALAISRRLVPRARSDLINRSMDTLGSPFSILAIRD